jgi:citronellol/citronellal dehydrogenase
MIATAAVKNLLGGEESMKRSRDVSIMGDSAHIILTSKSSMTTDNSFLVRLSDN